MCFFSLQETSELTDFLRIKKKGEGEKCHNAG